MTNFRTSACIAVLLSFAAATAFIPTAARAQLCPQYVAEYCVVEKDGFRHTGWTNPCFAAQRGARVLHLGACQGPICSNIWKPVCSINPVTGLRHTYSNLCWSDLANATLVHKGVCRPRHRHK